MTIPAALWPEVSRLLDEALNLDAANRPDWLERLEAGHPALAPHVRQLLAAHERSAAADPLANPPSQLMASALADHTLAQPQTLTAGQMLGPYRLRTLLGQGGMASVWLAEQTVNVLRRVALKIPHHGLEDPAATAERFTQERDFLASLEHPHIARLYDAGISAEGLPYLAMEWIDGVPINRYADDHRLDVRQRIVLFQQVLNAVRHAHARLVIHRDIKPTNILVTPEGQVKLLDFGIARLLGEGARTSADRAADASAESSTEPPAGSETASAAGPAKALTPETASPEQLAGDRLATPSDVYSLGIVLYELLSGQQPYRLGSASRDLGSAALHAAVLEARVRPPSQLPIEEDIARQRNTTRRQLRRALAGDLDAIVCKALMKQPSDRYDSAEAMNADLGRWQASLPVEARRGGVAYRANRFMVRNRVALTAGLAVTIALCVGLGLALWQAQRAREETRLAQAVQAFLTQLFDANDPQQAQGHDVSAKELLDRGAKRLDTELQDQPAVLARLQHEVGTIYIQLGNNLTARPHLEKSLQLYEKIGQEGSEDAIEAAFNLSEILKEDMQYAPARQAATRCLALADRHFGRHNRWRLPVQTGLAWMTLEEGHAQTAADMMVQALTEAGAMETKIDPSTGTKANATSAARDAAAMDPSERIQWAKSRAVLAGAYLELGQYEKARDEFLREVQESQQIEGYEITDQLVDRYNLARTRYNLREFETAAQELAMLVPLMDRHISARHDRSIKARALWAQSLGELGRYDQAIAVQQENLVHARAREASDDDILSLQQLVLAKLFKFADRPREGLPLARAGLVFIDAKYPDPQWTSAIGRRLIGEMLLQQGTVDAALKSLAAAAELARRIGGHSTHPAYGDILQVQAMALHLRSGHDDQTQAIRTLEEALPIYMQSLGADNPGTLKCATHLAWLQALASEADRAAALRFDAAARAFEASLPSVHVGHAELQMMRAELEQRSGAILAARARLDGARQQWRAAMGHEFHPPFVGLH